MLKNTKKRNGYRGLYPLRVNTICSVNGVINGELHQGFMAILNNGDRYILNAVAMDYKLPKLGTELDLSQHRKV